MSMHQAGNGPGNFQPAAFDALFGKLYYVHIKEMKESWFCCCCCQPIRLQSLQAPRSACSGAILRISMSQQKEEKQPELFCARERVLRIKDPSINAWKKITWEVTSC